MTKPKWLMVAMTAATLLSSYANLGYACGPFIDEAIFSFDTNPDFPLKRYAAGELGVIRPTFAKSYLVVAYRYLSNKPLSKKEQEGIYQLWKYRVVGNTFRDLESGASGDSGGTQNWLDARAKVVGSKNPPTIDTDRQIPLDGDNYNSYTNCTAGSFANAVKVLNSKIAKHGGSSPFVKDWVAAQDKVFCHCGTPGGAWAPKPKPAEPPFPDLPSGGGDPEVAQDRSYQHAAALFYAAQFDKAYAEFKAISTDLKSPYAKTARYMMPRCLIRKATLEKLDAASAKTILNSANTLVKEVLADPSMSELFSACRELLGFIAFRVDPDQRLKELSAEALADDKNVSANDYFHSVDDYTILLLNFEGGLDDEYASEKKPKPPLPAVVGKDDLSDWITTFERGDKSKFDHAVDRWHKTKSTAWLFLALHLAPADKSKTNELLTASSEIKADAPSFLSLGYEAAHVREMRGEGDAVVKELATLRDIATKKQLWSAVNLFMDMRGKEPMNLEQFVDNSVRKAAGFAVFDEYMEDEFIPPKAADKKNNPPFVFGNDNARCVNERLPLSDLTAICLTNKFPKDLQADAAQAAWTRALVLGDFVALSKMSPGFKHDYPSLSSQIDATDKGSDADKTFSGIYMILKNPGMRPYVRGGALRLEDFGKLDTYGDNWWSATAPDQEITFQEKGGDIVASKLKSDQYPKLLTAEQSATGVAERKKLLATGSAPTFLCAHVAEYAANHLTDPRVPEALSLAVRASHYGAKEGKTTVYSKKCFQILHSNFPKNSFTAKTPYYY